MKKSSTIFIFFFLAIVSLFAQDKKSEPANSFKYGYGTTFLGTGDFTGTSQYIEYDRNLFSRFSLGLNGTYTNALQNKIEGFQQSTKSYQGDANLFFNIFGNSVNRMKIGGGTSYRQSEHSYTTEIVRDSENIITDRVFEMDKSTNWGWSGVLEYEVFIARHIILGSKLMFQQFENGDKTYYWGLNAGFRF
jgi:hypothetical protein